MARISDLLADHRTVSFEFFPPKTEPGWLTLGRTIADLEPLQPGFVSVTYGAGGTTRSRTHDVVAWVRQETPITPMAHLTCSGHRRSEIAEILANYRAADVTNILALGGDPQLGPDDTVVPSDYDHAIDLVHDVHAAGPFCVGVAAHPEVHPRSPSRAADRRHLAAKLRIADFAVTQFFFDAAHYVRLLDELSALGVDKPVIPGIMPVTNLAQIRRMAALSGADVPAWLVELLESCGDDTEACYRAGVDAATALCQELLDLGAPGLHFYTLNRSQATREIAAALGLGAGPRR